MPKLYGRDANRDMVPLVGGSSGGGVQADWNQNNPAAADYIKNRICSKTPVEILPETELTFAPLDVFDGLAGAIVEHSEVPVGGQSYTVNYAGASYECVCLDMGSGEYLLGNTAAFGGDNTGEPFVIAPTQQEDGTVVSVILPLDGTESTVVSVTGEMIEKIPAEYLPGGVEVIDFVSVGFPTVTYGELIKFDIGFGDYPFFLKIRDALLKNGKFIAKVESDAAFPRILWDQAYEGGVVQEYEVCMHLERKREEDSFYAYAFWGGYIFYMFIMPGGITARLVKPADITFK